MILLRCTCIHSYLLHSFCERRSFTGIQSDLPGNIDPPRVTCMIFRPYRTAEMRRFEGRSAGRAWTGR